MHGGSLTVPPPLLTPARCLALLQSYARTRSLPEGMQLHAHIISSGLLSPSSSSSNHLLPSKLASMYGLCGDTANARLLFDRIHPKRRTPFLCNTLIRGYLRTGLPLNALHLFQQMISDGDRPDKFTFTFAIKACADLSWRRTGAQVHCEALVAGFTSDGYVQNSLIAVYMSCGDEEKARMVFEGMRDRTVVSWNTVIAGLFQNGLAKEALIVFDRMVDVDVEPDRATVVSVLPACAYLRDLRKGRQVHRLVDEKGFGRHIAVRNSLIDMYAKCDSLEEARLLFDNDEMCQRDVVSWTAMIGGYVSNGSTSEALALSRQMVLAGIRPNAVTVASLLSACASSSSTNHGKCVHGFCVRLILDSEIIVETALIDMYGKCSDMGLSALVFANGTRRTATWNAIISSYVRNGLPREAIKQFRLMQIEAVRPDMATVVSVLPAYSDLADLQEVKNMHCYLIRMGFCLAVEVTTGLIDGYSKTGNLEISRELFDGLPTKDIVSWSAIIAGYGMHGHARTAILLFDQMLDSGVEPNEITFASMLNSCSHAGLVDEGLHFFSSMVENHHMKPRADHYACIVDLLGRSGRLDEALGLIKAMPFKPNHAVWGALLGACVIHDNVELGEEAARHLFEIEPENTGNYVLLGNIYAAVERWKDAEAVRSMVKERGLKKAPGCSLIDVMNPRPHPGINS